MFLRMAGDPDSMPRKTPLQPLWDASSIASSSELLHLKYEYQSNPYRFLIIILQSSLKRGSGTLKVSSIKTTFFTAPSERMESSSFAIVSIEASVSFPALVG